MKCFESCNTVIQIQHKIQCNAVFKKQCHTWNRGLDIFGNLHYCLDPEYFKGLLLLYSKAILEIFALSLSYIPSYVHIRPGYREKSGDLQGTLKVHLQFYDRISRSHRPCNENWHAHYSLRARSMSTNTSMPQG